ncbi:ABC transporter permease subunit [Corynebacterium uropygiale]|uniref:ABC transporter permease subunit n=1 Tax=Corynebacterium uropygiale TaxID=1775911 RepID=A0A9X1QPF1_9CORY|nr:ATP-binding cassette domain-containing protein [Corynebacterium uropygiale]MCF4006939.1 ABC transporter permease subunit [Corynebacterium uropygiale]
MSRSLRRTPTRAPVLAQLLALCALLLLCGPLVALLARVSWTEVPEVWARPETREMLILTIAAAIQATVVTVILGVPLALVLQSVRRGAGIIRLLVVLPLAMPPVVAGLALSALAGRRGLLAPLLDALHLHFAFHFSGVVLAHVVITLPFVVVTVDAALRQMDQEVIASAAALGMSPGRIAWHIILPAILRPLCTGAGVACARSLGEFGTTLTFAGSLPGVTRTMPLGIYLSREIDEPAAYALAILLIGVAILVLALSALPSWLGARREPKHKARRLGEIDVDALRSLTRPQKAGPELRCGEALFPAGRLSALIGDNGSGKSTLASTLAGRVEDPRRPVGLSPEYGERPVMLTQSPGLPPHSTVARALTMITRDGERTRSLLAAAGLSALADVPVPHLSGGQSAQVALVRALAARPSALILDEPLAAVDRASAARWRRLFRGIARDRTTVLITHDPVDIATLAEELLVMDGGRCVAQGPCEELLRRPPTPFVASIAGLNRLSGRVQGVEGDVAHVDAEGLSITGTRRTALLPGEEAIAVFPPEALLLSPLNSPEGTPAQGRPTSARNRWAAHIEDISAPSGTSISTLLLRLDAPYGPLLSASLTREAIQSLGIVPGERVEVFIKATAISVFPA